MPEDFRRNRWSYRCPFCGQRSHNSNDVLHRYCAACGFQEDTILTLQLAADRSPIPGVKHAMERAMAAIRHCDRAFNEET